LYYQFNQTAPDEAATKIGFIPSSDSNLALRLSLQNRKVEACKITTRPPHSFVYVGGSRSGSFSSVLCLPKSTSVATALDWDRWVVKTEFSAPEGYLFYGHGAYIADLNEVFLSVYDKNLEGFLAVYDAKTFAFRRLMSSFGLAPHDMRYLKSNHILVVSNNGTTESHSSEIKSSLAFIDTQSGKLLKRFEPPEKNLVVQHVDALDPETVFCAFDQVADFKTSKLPLAGSAGIKKGLRLFERPKPFAHFNTLSVALDSEGQFGVTTTPEGHAVLWDLKNERPVRILESLVNPHGVVFSKSLDSFIISTAQSGLWQVFKTTHERKPERLSKETLPNIGSHMVLVTSHV